MIRPSPSPSTSTSTSTPTSVLSGRGAPLFAAADGHGSRTLQFVQRISVATAIAVPVAPKTMVGGRGGAQWVAMMSFDEARRGSPRP